MTPAELTAVEERAKQALNIPPTKTYTRLVDMPLGATVRETVFDPPVGSYTGPTPESVVRTDVPLLTAEVRKLRAALESVEWEGGDNEEALCPACQELKGDGHAPDCALAAALGRT